MLATATGSALLFLSTFSAPSHVRVPVVLHPVMHSVQQFDNMIALTNRVLDRSIATDIVRVATDLKTGEFVSKDAQTIKLAVEKHCKTRLDADGIKNPSLECSGK